MFDQAFLRRLAFVFLATGLALLTWIEATRPSAAEATSASQGDIKVVTTIKALHSLAFQVMDGVGEPSLLIDGAGSAHHYALKPSDAAELNGADLVFRIGPAIETFTEKIVSSLPARVEIVTLANIKDLLRYSARDAEHFDDHHGDHDHHDSGAQWDGHIWLDPRNATRIVDEMAEVLGRRFPEYSGTFRRNAKLVQEQLAALEAELDSRLAPVKDRPFAVLHDGTQYFERRFGLRNVAVISQHAETPPSARQLGKVREAIRSKGARCVFSDPQFDSRRIAAVIEGSDAQLAVLDPSGVDVSKGPGAYGEIMRGLADAFLDCLAGRKHD